MVKKLIIKGFQMKIINYNHAYTNKNPWKKEIEKKKGFYNIKTEIKNCCVESVSNVVDYEEYSSRWGGPIIDIRGDRQDWFRHLYYIKYQSKIRILPA